MTKLELKVKGGTSSLRLFYSSDLHLSDALMFALRDARKRHPGCKFKLVDIVGTDPPKVQIDPLEEMDKFLQMKKLKNANNSSNKA